MWRKYTTPKSHLRERKARSRSRTPTVTSRLTGGLVMRKPYDPQALINYIIKHFL